MYIKRKDVERLRLLLNDKVIENLLDDIESSPASEILTASDVMFNAYFCEQLEDDPIQLKEMVKRFQRTFGK